MIKISTGNRKKSVFRLNRHETENTKKTIYITETETEKKETETEKRTFSKINFLNVEKSLIYVFMICFMKRTKIKCKYLIFIKIS
jgi:hypothetical protein